MVKKEKVKKVLETDSSLLIREDLIILGKDEKTCYYCSMGLLLRAAGVSDDELFNVEEHGSSDSDTLYGFWGSLLQTEYGLEKHHVQNILSGNDNTKFVEDDDALSELILNNVLEVVDTF